VPPKPVPLVATPVVPVQPQPIPVVASPAAVEPPAPAKPDPAAIERQRYAGVQNALNQIGYGPVPSDGSLNDETINAIRRFELDNGLPITGKIGSRLIDRLVAIGAMKAT
jgi:peptidoglycan hydrolase-like protein with peptidoglycan-binding domain